MEKLVSKLGIDETLTRAPVNTEKKYSKIRQQIPPLADTNMMADLLQLPLTEQKYGYCLVVVDLWTDEFDIEPLKVDPKKREGVSSAKALAALRRIFQRKHLNLPRRLTTDNGSEFKGDFHKYLHNKNVYHKYAMPYRHQQMSKVERLNRTLGRLFLGYLNAKEQELGRDYNEWTDVVPIIREDLNAIRAKAEQDPFTKRYKQPNLYVRPEFEVGDLVHRRLEYPLRFIDSKKQPTAQFREGDLRFEKFARKIVEVLPYPPPVPYRYLLEGIRGTSFPAWQLLKSQNADINYIIDKIVDKKRVRGRVHYRVRWKGFDASQDTWEPRAQLLADGQGAHIRQFEDGIRRRRSG